MVEDTKGARRTTTPWRPTRAQLLEASDRTIRDVIAPDLDVLFCGINPGLYSGATGHHFAHPANRFWRVLYEARISPRLMSPFEDRELLSFGVGITNLVRRTTVNASELSSDELRDGARKLEQKVRRYRPGVLAVLGMQAYRTGFGSRATLGIQERQIGGRPVFVLPNPSGLQARYQLPELVALFGEVREFASRAPH